MLQLKFEAGRRVSGVVVGVSFGILVATNAVAEVVSLERNDDAASVHVYPQGTVNAILGDESFLALRGSHPDPETNEDLRLATHLEYVEQQLRAVDTSSWSPERRAARIMMLDHLHDYWTAGAFPRNVAYEHERRPCFIDDDGRICAVGYLIEMTAGRDVSEAINERWQYDYLLEMNMPEIDSWVEHSGLTAVECAMIQPCYGPDGQWWDYDLDFGDGITIDHGNAVMALFDIPTINETDMYILDIVSELRLSLDITHSRMDDLTILLRSPEASTPLGAPCLFEPHFSPSIESTFMLANDAPLGGASSMLDGVYEWADGPVSIEQGAQDAAGGLIAPGSYASWYSALDDYTHGVLFDGSGNPTMHGAWAPGAWELWIIDENDNLDAGVLRHATLSMRLNALPTPGALSLLGLVAVAGRRRRL